MSVILLAKIAQTSTRYYATQTYCTHGADTPAHTLWEGRLSEAIYERAVTHPVWSRTGAEQAISFLEFVNTDGALDSWLSEDWKDIRVTLYTVAERAAFSTAVQVGVAVVDTIEAPSGDRIRLVCRSVFERLEKIITSSYSDSIGNESLRDSPKPITLGNVRWLDPFNHTINDPAGATRGLYDVADDWFEDIAEVRSRGGLLTETSNAIVTSGSSVYWIQQTDGTYGFRRGREDNRIVAEVHGQIRRGANIVTDPTFQVGTPPSGDPTQFDAVEGGAGSVTLSALGTVTIIGDGTAQTYIAQDQSLTDGQLYQLEVEVSSVSGVASLFYGTTIVRSFEGVVADKVVACFTAATGTDDIRVGYETGASGTLVINAFRCFPAHRINSLAEIVRFAAVERGSLATGDLDTTALAAIDTATGYAIGWHSIGTEVRGIDLVRDAAVSFGVGLFTSADGKIKPVQLAEPAVSADYELDELSILDVTVEVDRAPGLSTRMEYGRNYAPHTSDDMAGIAPTSTAAVLIRAELQRDVLTVTTTETLDAIYSDATDRPPIRSLLASQADAQAEIDRLCALYTVPRAFYTVRAFIEDGSAHEIEPGDTVAVTHSRYGLSGGKNLLVVGARSDFVSEAVDLVLWG